MMEQIEKKYIETFNEKEKIAYEIAKKLGSSFQIEKSVGFLEWKSQLPHS